LKNLSNRIKNMQRKFLLYTMISFFLFIIFDYFKIFPYGIGRIPIQPESAIPGIKYLYAIGFSYIFGIIMLIIKPKRTVMFLLAIPPIKLIYKIIKKIFK